MKKWILSAALLLAMSGFAAAQSTKAQAVPKTQNTATKKGNTQKAITKKTEMTVTNETATVLPVKLNIVLPDVDTTGIPVRSKQ
jgi:hypothetical protein